MTGCYEPNLKLRQAERLFEERLIGPESLANIGGQYLQCNAVRAWPFTQFVPAVCALRNRLREVKLDESWADWDGVID